MKIDTIDPVRHTWPRLGSSTGHRSLNGGHLTRQEDAHMPANLIKKDAIAALAARAAGLEQPEGSPRLKQVVNRLLTDLMTAIDELDISMDEFWSGIA